MPQFIMNDNYVDRFLELPGFIRGYIEAMFFTEECPGVTIEEFHTAEFQKDMEAGRADGNIPGEAGFNNLAKDSLIDIIQQCTDFQVLAAADLALAYEGEYDAEQAGRDFWLTRNGHGVGFWDRGLGDVGDRLSKSAKTFGEVYVEFGDDDKVYHR